MSAAPISSKQVVTLDGPSGVGKTAVARELARVLGWRWLSTGMLYRAIATGGSDALPRVEFRRAADGVDDPVVQIGDRRLGERDLRDGTLAQRASQLATDPTVRSTVDAVLETLTSAQRFRAGLVLEGRSGYRVAPFAAQHIYLWADTAARAARTAAIGETLDANRDRRDSEREHDPLRVRAGMTVWNSTRYTLDQTVAGLARRVRMALGVQRPIVAVLRQDGPTVERPDDDPAPEFDLRESEIGDTGAAVDVLGGCEFAVVVPAGHSPSKEWLAAHLDALLRGNDLVAVGPPAGLGLTGVDRNLRDPFDRDALSRAGNVAFTCDMLTTQDRAGRGVWEWWAATARESRWVFVPAARLPIKPDEGWLEA